MIEDTDPERRRLCVVLVAVLVLCVTFTGCGARRGDHRASGGQREASSAQTTAAPEQQSQFRVQSRGVRELSWQEGGHYIMRASAKSLRFDEETQKAALAGARVALYRQGEEALVFTAPSVEADGRSRTLSAGGGVVAESALRKTRMASKTAKWTLRSQELVLQGGVRVESDIGSLSADSAVAESDLKHVTLRSSSGGGATLRAGIVE